MFGNNPWAGRKWGGQQPFSPMKAPQVLGAGPFPQNTMSQTAPLPQMGFQPPQVQWPGQNADMNFANQLAGYYASQMPNQQVPGSAPLPTFQPPQQTQPVGQVPLPQGDWRDAFKQARMDWKMAMPGRGTDAWAAWRQARPDRDQFRPF